MIRKMVSIMLIILGSSRRTALTEIKMNARII